MNPEVVTAIAPAKLTLAEVQARLLGKKGKRFWQSLDEVSADPGFEAMVREEFPRQASEWTDGVSRRSFMKVMGASLALAGMTGCTKQPDETIYPYIKSPEDLVLGKPMYFATAMPFPTGAIPVVVKTDAFRPIKIDGNPEHPMSKGKTDIFAQASLLDLYDPDRAKHPVKKMAGESMTAEYGEFAEQFAQQVKATGNGQGVWFLTDVINSPTLEAQWKQVAAKYPAAKLVQYSAISGSVTGDMPMAQYKLENADVILSLDADFLSSNAFPGFLPMAAGYAERHRYEEGKPMNRLYVVETMPSVTGFKAEHRISLKPSDVVAFANALNGGGSLSGDAHMFMEAVTADLKKAGSKAVVVAGPHSSASVQAAAMAMNQALGAVGSTVSYSAAAAMPGTSDLKQLISAMNAGQVKVLVALCNNIAYTAPADLNFGAALAKVPFSVYLGQHMDETGVSATWALNEAHYLESWSDTRSADGTISIVQPMIDPLYNGVSPHHILQSLLENPTMSPMEVVKTTAKTYISGDFNTGWTKALHDGWVEATAYTASSAAPKAPTMTMAAPAAGGIEINFKADPSTYDGRYANNGWLQELPKQVTRMAWDNAAIMSAETMHAIGAEETDLIELTLNGRTLIIPPLVIPGHAPESITVHLGMGRDFGRVAQGVGSNGYKLRTADAPFYQGGLTAKKSEGKHDLCVTQVHDLDHRGKTAQRDLAKPEDPKASISEPGHEAMERSIIRYATLDEAKKNPGFAHEDEGTPNLMSDKYAMKETPDKENSFFPHAWDYKNTDASSGQLQNAWGMAIDLNSCIGCNACVVSCYAENNIPVVGREQVKVGRKMDWIRIDTYFEGDLHAPKAHFQPMLCQHCENAGCEQVCPVGATVHTPEGLNAMVYNRCVGTRYCSNNCPYKVRRFNFLLYSDYEGESLKLMRNPDVSVRSRGVMEKCTYCVQRIQQVKIQADKEGRAIMDGEIQTACQQACPTDAIIFGNQNDPNSRVAKHKASERNYAVLGDLNYRPRTTYVAGVINPNPALHAEGGEA